MSISVCLYVIFVRTWQQYAEVVSVFHIGERTAGHAGIVHGGMTAALADEVQRMLV